MDSSDSQPTISVTHLPPIKLPETTPSHHVGNPPTSFRNPWPSFTTLTPWELLQTRFASDRNFVPVPPRKELVNVQAPDWGSGQKGLKATWIGHASFLIETATQEGADRGVRLLLDPVWSERTSPVTWAGPKRYTPTPCTLEALPEVDVVVTSHNHYDHLDTHTIRELYRLRKGRIHFLCALGNAAWFHSVGIQRSEVTELDWWQGVRVDVPAVGSVSLVCTPCQHMSARTPFNIASALWCSWVIEEASLANSTTDPPNPQTDPLVPHQQSPLPRSRKLFFAGDTGYRGIPSGSPPPIDLVSDPSLPCCPAFAEIGALYGPFDLALLPIGLYSPRRSLAAVHCAPEDSVCVHVDLQSRKSIGMHWGTVRGGISGQFEDVREPPRRWREAAEKRGLVWGNDVGLLDVGGTEVVD